MLIQQPYRDYNSKESREFYSNALAGYDINVSPNNVKVTPYARQGDFSLTANLVGTHYFDIGNVAFGNIPAGGTLDAYGGRSSYHGSLKLCGYVTAVVTNLSLNCQLATGLPTNLTHWLYKNRNAVTAADANINAPGAGNAPGFLDVFDDAFFTLLAITGVAVGGPGTYRIEYMFHGVRIDY